MRVLIIDDEKFIADTLVMILEDSGLQAAAAYDGATGIEQAESFHPDVVISDVIMPGLNGIETCSAIQAKYPECRCFLFSGQSATVDLIHAEEAKGVNWELLAKPIEPEELLAKLAVLR